MIKSLGYLSLVLFAYSAIKMLGAARKMRDNRQSDISRFNPFLPFMDSKLLPEGRRWRDKMAYYCALTLLFLFSFAWCSFVIPMLWK